MYDNIREVLEIKKSLQYCIRLQDNQKYEAATQLAQIYFKLRNGYRVTS